MHGSGTSVVSQLLRELGVFMGSVLDSHYEAVHFSTLNEDLLYRAGGSWHRPEPLLHKLEGGLFRGAAAARLALATFGSLRDYLPVQPVGAWGWKDPRNSLTLPVWLRLFPHAQVVHVYREPEAAARSVHRRAHRELTAGALAYGGSGPVSNRLLRAATSPSAVLRYLGRRVGVVPRVDGDPCLDLDYCRALSRQYVESCIHWRGAARSWVEVRYEDLLQEPEGTVARLATFVGAGLDPARIAEAATVVRRPVA